MGICEDVKECLFGKRGPRYIKSSTAATPAIVDLHVIQFSLQLLDGAVGHLQVFIESVAFSDELSRSVNISHNREGIRR